MRRMFNILWLSALGLGIAAPSLASPSGKDVLDLLLEKYRPVRDYVASVVTYRTHSLYISDSELSRIPPLMSFSIFYKNGRHVVRGISGPEGMAIFRIELLSGLQAFSRSEVSLVGQERLEGVSYDVLEVTASDRPESRLRLWVDPRRVEITRLSIYIGDVEFARTQFFYSGPRWKSLPVETRTLFPTTGVVLINRVVNYEVNVGLSDSLFEEE